MEINTLCDEAHKTAKEKGWHDEELTFERFACLAHSEISEAVEDFRNHKPITQVMTKGCTGKPVGIPIELADVVIRIADFCGLHGIDLDQAIKTKMSYNKTRAHKHGGKKI